MTQAEKAVLKTLVYADLFNWPLTKKEIFQKLHTPNKISLPLVKGSIKRLVANGLIHRHLRYYFLSSNDKSIAQNRINRVLSAKNKINQARLRLPILFHCPWISGIYITGSAAVLNTQKQDDIDFLVITQPNRLWLTRLWIIMIAEFLKKRRRPREQQFANKWCFNLFLERKHLSIPSSKQNLFTASELIQVKPVFLRQQTHQEFIQANLWFAKYFGNYTYRDWKSNNNNSNRPHFLNLFHKIADQLNYYAYLFQYYIMRHKITTEYISLHSAFFHPGTKDRQLLALFNARKKSMNLI